MLEVFDFKQKATYLAKEMSPANRIIYLEQVSPLERAKIESNMMSVLAKRERLWYLEGLTAQQRSNIEAIDLVDISAEERETYLEKVDERDGEREKLEGAYLSMLPQQEREDYLASLPLDVAERAESAFVEALPAVDRAVHDALRASPEEQEKMMASMSKADRYAVEGPLLLGVITSFSFLPSPSHILYN